MPVACGPGLGMITSNQQRSRKLGLKAVSSFLTCTLACSRQCLRSLSHFLVTDVTFLRLVEDVPEFDKLPEGEGRKRLLDYCRRHPAFRRQKRGEEQSKRARKRAPFFRQGVKVRFEAVPARGSVTW